MYLMCGPRQLFFIQGGPEMPKGWTPLVDGASRLTLQVSGYFVKYHSWLQKPLLVRDPLGLLMY